MKKILTQYGVCALVVALMVPLAHAQGPEPKFNSNAEDLAKIRGILEEFRQDIIRKDGNALTKLVLNPNVLFHQKSKRNFTTSRFARTVLWGW